MSEELNFADLMPKETGSMKSLNEFLREQRIRLNRSDEDIRDCEKLLKRGSKIPNQWVGKVENG